MDHDFNSHGWPGHRTKIYNRVMQWEHIAWVLVAALFAVLIGVTCLALLQVSKARRMQALHRALWIILIVFATPLGVLLWFLYGRPHEHRLN